MYSKEIEETLKIGKPLFEVGINNWALTKSEAIIALEKFSFLKIPILGGDVYEILNGVLQSNYDNWYCEPLPEETRNDFVNRSINKARNYIESYKAKVSTKTFFVLVPDA